MAGKDLGKMQLSNDALKMEISNLRAKAQDETKRLQAVADERYVWSLNDHSLLCIKSSIEYVLYWTRIYGTGQLQLSSMNYNSFDLSLQLRGKS